MLTRNTTMIAIAIGSAAALGGAMLWSFTPSETREASVEIQQVPESAWAVEIREAAADTAASEGESYDIVTAQSE